MTEAIAISNLKKYYGKSRGVEDVNLIVEEGDFFGFIGPNGAGKSTTIRILLGLLVPDEGTVSFFGRYPLRYGSEQLEEIGYLPSEVILYPEMKVRDLLRFSAKLRKKDCFQRAEQLCGILGLDQSRKVKSLSLGNRKKVGIVCALQHDPKLVILDEPTSGLDPLMQKTLFDLLHQLNASGTTILFSSHNLTEVQDHCSKAAIIKDGKIAACGKVSDLLKQGAKKIRFKGTLAAHSLNGITEMKEDHEGYSFLFHGDMNELLFVLQNSCIDDLQILDPDLEDIFLSYYAQTEAST